MIDDESTDDELGINLQLGERLQINKPSENYCTKNSNENSKEFKQYCNSKKKEENRLLFANGCAGASGTRTPSPEPMFTGGWFVPETPSPYQLGNKKRQNGDKNGERIAKSKRTCLSDRFYPSVWSDSRIKNGFHDDHPRPFAHLSDRIQTLHDPTERCAENGIPIYGARSGSPDCKESQAVEFMERDISPDETYENCIENSTPLSELERSNANVSSPNFPNHKIFSPMKTSDLINPFKENLSLPSTSRSAHSSCESSNITSRANRSKPFSRGVQFIDSDSDEEATVSVKNGSLKGGRQTPDTSYQSRKLIGKGTRRILDSDDSDDHSWQNTYRCRPSGFSPTDSDSSNETQDASCSNRISNLSTFRKQSSTDSNERPFSTFCSSASCLPTSQKSVSSCSKVSNHSVSESKGSYSNTSDDRLTERSRRLPRENKRGSPVLSFPGEVSNQPSCRNDPSSPLHIRSRFSKQERAVRRSGSPHPRSLRCQRHQSGMSRTSVGQIGSVSHNCPGRMNLAARFPDLFDAEDSSDVEFFTANSYSDSETGNESLAGIEINATIINCPDSRSDTSLVCEHSVHVGGSSEDEISVIFSTNSPFNDGGNARRRQQHRGIGRRRHGRGSNRSNISGPQDVVVSLSPDPVEQVRQMEEDERLARMLQAQFDAEINEEEAASDSHSVMDSEHEDEAIDPVGEIIDDIAGVFTDSFPHQSRQRQQRRRSSSQPPFQFTGQNRGGIRGRPRAPPNVFGLPAARGRQSRRRFHRLQSDPWMWQFARMLGLGPSHHSPDHDGSDYEALLELAENVGEALPRGLRKTEINRLPTRKYIAPNLTGGTCSNSYDASHRRTELNKECQVCLSDYENGDVLRILPCFHEFHTICIDPWLKINHTCPVCRVEVDLDD